MEVKCVSCEQTTSSPYWVNPKSGSKSNVPYCPQCYEDGCRRQHRETARRPTEKPLTVR